MQTIEQKQLSHVERPGGTHRPDEPRGQQPGHEAHAPEGLQLLEGLIQDEAHMRWQAEQLEAKAREVENDGNDAGPAIAGHMRAQASIIRGIAAEMGSLITEIRADPNRRVSRRKVDALRTASVTAIAAGEEEIDVAEHAHSGGVEYKEQLRHIVATKAHAPEKSKPKAVGKPKQNKSAAGCAPVEPTPPSKMQTCAASPKAERRSWWDKGCEKLAVAKEKMACAGSSLWSGVKETASDVADNVGAFVQGGVCKAKQLAGSAVSFVSQSAPVVFMAEYSGKVVNALVNPRRTVSKLAGRVADNLSAAKDNVVGLVRRIPWFGQDEDDAKKEEESKTPAAAPLKPMDPGIAAALSTLPACLLPVAKTESQGTWLSPLATSGVQPLPWFSSLTL